MSTTVAGARVPFAPMPVPTAADRTSEAAGRFSAVLHTDPARLRAAWDALGSPATCTAYQRYEWIDGIVSRLMPARKASPVVVEVRDADSGKTVMLLPFARIRRFGHVVLTWLDLGVSDYAAPLLADGFVPDPEAAAAAWAAARAVLPKVDLIHIERIPGTIGTVPNPLVCLAGVRPIAMQAHGLPIDGDADTLLQRICSKSTLKKFTRTERKLSSQGEVRFVQAETPADIEEIFAALLDQRRQRFRDLGRFDLLDRPDVQSFYRAQAHAGLSGGPARMFGLSVNGTWIATALGLVHEGVFHGILLAMDNGWRPFGPGLRIITEIMLWSRRQGITFFDLTVGDLPYKADLGAVPRRLHELAQATTLRGQAVMAGTHALARAKARLQANPKLFEVMRAGRQALRRRLKRGRT